MSKKSTNTEHLRSPVWQYFTRNTASQLATCSLCKSTLKAVGGSTRSLHIHLQSKHKINLLRREAAGDDDDHDNEAMTAAAGRSGAMFSTTASASACGVGQVDSGKVTRYFGSGSYTSMAATVSRMAACDGMSFHVFCSSPDLRRVMAAAGYTDLPKSPSATQALVMRHAGDIQSQLKLDLKAKLKEGKRFSITFDEWTSVRSRRYMAVNLHEGEGNQFWSLGLVRVSGSMPADRCIELLKSKLGTFGLNLETDIVGICTDGASVMCKVGKLLGAEHQLCLAHGVHLAVHDVLYKRTPPTAASMECTETEAACDDDHDQESDDEDDDALDTDVTSDGGSFQVDSDTCHTCDGDAVAELSPQYRQVIMKVRKIAKMFRNSPVKNDSILQKYVKEDHQGMELSVILDCPTRWNSLLTMLSRFSSLRTSIQKAMIDLKAPEQVTDADFTVIDEIVTALEPVALAVQMLSRQDVNLLSAEAALKFCVMELRKQQSELGKTMAMALHARVCERYRIHSLVLRYLHTGDASSDFSESGMSSMAIRKFVHRLLLRLDYMSSSAEPSAAVTTTSVPPPAMPPSQRDDNDTSVAGKSVELSGAVGTNLVICRSAAYIKLD